MALNITTTPIKQQGSSWTGYSPQMLSSDIYNPQQTQMLNQLLQMGMTGLSPQNLSYEPIRKRIMSDFTQNVIPSISERFTSMGEGAQGSSGFRGALMGGLGDLGERLSALGSQYNMQMAPLYMSMLQQGLTPQQQQMYMPGSQGALQTSLAGLMQGLGQAIPGMATGGWSSLWPMLSGLLRGAGTGGGGGVPTGTQQPISFVQAPSVRSVLQSPSQLELT